MTKNARFNFMLNPFTTHAFKVLCAKQSKSMSSLVNNWIKDYLQENKISIEDMENVD